MKFKPEDLVVLILATTIGLFVLAISFRSLFQDAEMTESRVKILNTLLTSFVSIISMYIGFKMGKK